MKSEEEEATPTDRQGKRHFKTATTTTFIQGGGAIKKISDFLMMMMMIRVTLLRKSLFRVWNRENQLRNTMRNGKEHIN